MQGHSYHMQYAYRLQFHVSNIGYVHFGLGALVFVSRGIFMFALRVICSFLFGALKFVDRGIFMSALLDMFIFYVGHSFL